MKAPPRGVDDGDLPAPLRPAYAGYPQGGVPVARGLIARLLAPSPLQPPVVVDSNPATLIHKKAPHLYHVRGFLFKGPSRGANSQGLCHHFLRD